MAELIKATDNLNEGRLKLNNAITDSEKALNTANAAKATADLSKAESESTQTQLDTIVIEGDSSVEAAQARVDSKGVSHTTLKSRIDNFEVSTAQQLAETEQDLTAQLQQTNKLQLEQRNAKMPLDIRTYDGSYQSTHPSVVNTGTPFSGFNYWMAYTPYPFSNDDYENPCIQYSNNGMEWLGDLTPIDKPTAQETSDGAYMSDPELIFINGKLELFYRFNTNTSEVLLRKTSNDGFVWSEREVIYSAPAGGAMSPSIIYENGMYRMWYVRYSGEVMTMESQTGAQGTWSTPKNVPVTFRNESYTPWHLQVFKESDGTYKLVLNASEQTPEALRHILMGQSNDGYSFSDTYLFMSPLKRPYTFDKTFLYRASLVKGLNGEYMLYYSAYSNDTGWRIGMSAGATIDSIQAIDYKSLYNQTLLPEIKTPGIELSTHKAKITNEYIYLATDGVKAVKLLNKFPDEIHVVNELGQPVRMVAETITLSNGSQGGNIGSTEIDNVLQVKNNANNGHGHLEVAHVLLKYTTNTLNIEGALRYNPDIKKLEFYTGLKWETVTSN